MSRAKVDQVATTSLSQALKSFWSTGRAEVKNCAVALLYGTDRCVFARVDRDGNLEFHHEAPAPKLVYEARIFDSVREIRWVADPETVNQEDGPYGRTYVLDSTTTKDLTPQAGSYLLWGTAREKSEKGWTWLFEHRIGNLYAPLGGVAKDAPVQLNYVEYFGPDQGDEDGNVVVVAERLTELLPAAKV